MFPWLAIWAPHLYFPWSGSVNQRIEPNTSWFFDSIDFKAGNGRIEKKAVEIASYGRQLGLITEVLLDVAEREGHIGVKAKEAVRRLKKICDEIEEIKREDAAATAQEIEERLNWLKKTNAAEFGVLARRLRTAIEEHRD